MGNTKIIPRGFGPALVLVLLAGVVVGLGQWWADGGSQAVQLTRCGALLAEAWEAAAVEEVLFRGVLLWACLSWARRRNEAYPRRALRAHRLAGLRAVVDPVAGHGHRPAFGLQLPDESGLFVRQDARPETGDPGFPGRFTRRTGVVARQHPDRDSQRVQDRKSVV